MEQLKSMYETVFIVNNTIGEEAVKAVVEIGRASCRERV